MKKPLIRLPVNVLATAVVTLTSLASTHFAHAEALSPAILNCRDLFTELRDDPRAAGAGHLVDPAQRKTVDPKVIAEIASSPSTRAMLDGLLKFAEKHGLDERVIEVGPANRRLKRLVVALDVRNKALVKDYMETFNLHDDVTGENVKTLSVEFSKELEAATNGYVFTTIRTGKVPGMRDGLWRWGKTSTDQTADWFVDHYHDQDKHITGFAHLIPLTNAEATNVDYFLKNPDERGPCKSDNCVAWLPGIELGKTGKDSTTDERRLLFNELGVSRSVAHFEVARRMIHASNERNVAIVAYIADDIGLKNFRDPNSNILPPEPKLPFTSIVHGLISDQTSPIATAMRAIPDGAKVFFPIAAGASPEGMSALIDRSLEMKNGVDVHVLVNGISEATFRRGVTTTDGKFRVHPLFLGGNMRQLHQEGLVKVVPGYLADFSRYVADPKLKNFKYDAIVVRVAPADKEGRYSLGTNNDMIRTILRLRPGIKVIAEVNPNVPVTLGENYLTEKEITAKFLSTSSLAGPAVFPIDDVDRALGSNLASLIPNNSTVQLGIGAAFAGLADAMRAKRRVGIRFFTEMMGDPMKQMIQNGVAVEAQTGFAFGSEALYKWLDHNPRVRVVPTEYVNNPSRIAAIPRFHAVNTALQVNLRGDVNATQGPDGRISSPGGQVEFMSGAIRSPEGKAIIALRSKHRYKAISMISLDLYNGEKTTPHEMVSYVVTEYGVAALSGLNEAERAVALIRIAHPTFRSSLAAEALARGMITPQMRAEWP